MRAVQERLLAGCVIETLSSGGAIAKSESQQPPQHTGTSSPMHRGGDPEIVLPLCQLTLAAQRHQIDDVAGEMPGVQCPAGAARE